MHLHIKRSRRLKETIIRHPNISRPCIIELATPLILLAGRLI